MKTFRRTRMKTTQTARLSVSYATRLGGVGLVVAFVIGCATATQPKESGKAADSVASPYEAKAPSLPVAVVPSNQPQPHEEALTNTEDRAEKSKGSPSPTYSKIPSGERKRGAPTQSAKEGEFTPPRSGARPPSKASAPVFDNAEIQPAYAEPPELASALLEFESNWDALSTSRACDDACRAFESMRRSAQKICDLVLDGDPKARCPTAKARLEQASRDLSARCSTCR
jgi:hypothetical protein